MRFASATAVSCHDEWKAVICQEKRNFKGLGLSFFPIRFVAFRPWDRPEDRNTFRQKRLDSWLITGLPYRHIRHVSIDVWCMLTGYRCCGFLRIDAGIEDLPGGDGDRPPLYGRLPDGLSDPRRGAGPAYPGAASAIPHRSGPLISGVEARRERCLREGLRVVCNPIVRPLTPKSTTTSPSPPTTPIGMNLLDKRGS